ncbi:bifunctional tetrahydrofolate synthase/dihydrofolate synthase [Aestuariirhabdus sp. LZHN29]|uniref:bifunctional tetrahydrofolate synthase/dihydrofolate synthase n=1 Tax=Aestuariirhabdus sp. LZHN29 TaxID=3417462 RepID=UPI003CF10A9D
MKPDSLESWLGYLEQLHPIEIDLGLERVASVAKVLGVLNPTATVFTVAGTNGKGSTCALLSSMLGTAGYRVGVYSSPHLLRYNERILLDGVQASDDQIVASFERIEQARGAISLSYFEFATLAALDLFTHSDLDAWILEVGLGGRLDAVNIIDADVAVVTSIAVDHEQWLGSELEGIGREKAGIFRPFRPAVYGGRQANAGVSGEAQRISACWLARDEAFVQRLDGETWRYEGADRHGVPRTISGLPMPDLPYDNAATAICALLSSPLNISDDAICAGIRKARLAGRYQQFKLHNPAGAPIHIVLDVAHNPQAAEVLCERLRESPAQGTTRCVIAMLDDKDVEGVVAALAPQCSDWFLSELSSPRACPSERLKAALEGIACERFSLYSNVGNALAAAIEASSPGDRILVAGSFLTVADALNMVEPLHADPA